MQNWKPNSRCTLSRGDDSGDEEGCGSGEGEGAALTGQKRKRQEDKDESEKKKKHEAAVAVAKEKLWSIVKTLIEVPPMHGRRGADLTYMYGEGFERHVRVYED